MPKSLEEFKKKIEIVGISGLSTLEELSYRLLMGEIPIQEEVFDEGLYQQS